MAAARPPVTGATQAERRRADLSRRAGLDTLGEADLRKDYGEHPDRYRRPALVRVSQLFFPTREAADVALKKLKDGAAWMDVSRGSSAAPNAASGGALGLLGRSDLPQEFEKAIWALPAGGTTGILAAPHGFHIFRVEERSTPGISRSRKPAPASGSRSRRSSARRPSRTRSPRPARRFR